MRRRRERACGRGVDVRVAVAVVVGPYPGSRRGHDRELVAWRGWWARVHAGVGDVAASGRAGAGGADARAARTRGRRSRLRRGAGTLSGAPQPRRVRDLDEARARVVLSASSAVRRDRSVVPSADESLYSCAIAPGACMMMYKVL